MNPGISGGSGFKELDSKFLISGTWILDSNDSQEFFKLNTGIQSLGFRITEYASKKLPGFQNPDITFHWANRGLSTFELNLVYVVQLIFYLR